MESKQLPGLATSCSNMLSEAWEAYAAMDKRAVTRLCDEPFCWKPPVQAVVARTAGIACVSKWLQTSLPSEVTQQHYIEMFWDVFLWQTMLLNW